MAFGRLNTDLTTISNMLCSDLSSRFRVLPEFVDWLDVGDGLFSRSKSSHKSGGYDSKIFIGVSGIDLDSERDGFELFRVAYHEARHLEQFQTNYDCCDTEFSKEFRRNDAACDGSPWFYGIKYGCVPFPHYYSNCREREAELYGLSGAYRLLMTPGFSGVGDPEQFVLDYLYNQHRTKVYLFGRTINHDYYIQSDRRFDSFDDVVQTCKQQISDSFNESCVPYRPPDFMKGPVDFLMDDMPDVFCNIKDRLYSTTDYSEQCLMLASLDCLLYPERLEIFPEQEKDSVSTEAVFGMKAPRIPWFVRKKIDSQIQLGRKSSYNCASEAMRKLLDANGDMDDRIFFDDSYQIGF